MKYHLGKYYMFAVSNNKTSSLKGALHMKKHLHNYMLLDFFVLVKMPPSGLRPDCM